MVINARRGFGQYVSLQQRNNAAKNIPKIYNIIKRNENANSKNEKGSNVVTYSNENVNGISDFWRLVSR